MLHEAACSVSSQGSPLCAGCTTISRVFSWTPPPHCAEHSDHPPQSPTTQSTGHSSSLHDSIASNGGHFVPPPAGCTMMLRNFLSVPPPQVTEHPSSLQSETSQSSTST